jgi:hypothetical protein
MRTQHRLSAAPELLLVLVTAQLCFASAGYAQDASQPSRPTIAMEPVTPPVTSIVRKKLDLRPPKITEVYSQETIDRALRQARDPRTIEEVEVEGRREPAPSRTPNIPGGIFAPFWALANPSQSWRILLPLAPDQAERYSGPPPSATDPYRPPVLPPR